MQINGRYITKEVTVTMKVLDESAYWWLDYEGNEDTEGGFFLYDKVAYPRVTDAQHHHRVQAENTRSRHARKVKRERPVRGHLH